MPTTDRQPNQTPPVQRPNVGRPKRTTKASEIRWNEWWPFERATGNALKQLNKKQPKQQPEYEEAPL